MLSHISSFLTGGPQLCLRFTPTSPHAALYAAFICGLDLPSGWTKELFVQAGLIHIMVVSGGHLLFAERLLFKLSRPMVLTLLTSYCWLTGWGTPVLRAFVRRLCEAIFADWGWSPLQLEAQSTVLILLFRPDWLHSRSFLMSWACALALQTPGQITRLPHLNTCLKCYAYLLPFSPSSPLTVAWNALVAPIMGQILFPTCLLAFALPPFTSLADGIWNGLLWALENGPILEWQATPLKVGDIWWLPALWHIGLLWGEYKWRRAVAFLSS